MTGNTLSKRERVDAALAGLELDRVPVSAWRHFLPEEQQVETLAEASLHDVSKYDWDWLKVNPRATYYAEAWGNRYDYGDYQGVLPRVVDGPVSTPADVGHLKAVSPTVPPLSEQLRLLGLIKNGIGDVRFIQTVFTPLSILAFIAANIDRETDPYATNSRPQAIRRLIEENPSGAHAALAAIAETMAGFASRVVDAGASGLFFAIVGLARRGVLTEDEYKTFGVPYDLKVLEAVRAAPFNVLHICGPEVHFDVVDTYPVHAVNWAAVGQSNPGLDAALLRTRHAVIGGVDETTLLRNGKPEAVEAAAREAIRSTGGRRFLLTPGCAVAVDTPEPNLHALRRAAEPVSGAASGV